MFYKVLLNGNQIGADVDDLMDAFQIVERYRIDNNITVQGIFDSNPACENIKITYGENLVEIVSAATFSLRMVLDHIEHVLVDNKSKVVLLEDGSSDNSAYMAFQVGGLGYTMSLSRAEQYDNKEE